MPRPPRSVCLAALAIFVAGAPQAQRAAPDASARRAEAEGRLIRGMTELAMGNDSAAVRQFTLALRAAPGDAAVLDALAEAHATARAWPSALDAAEQAAAAAPAEAAVHLRLGQIRAAAGVPGATVALVTARRLAPTRPDVLAALAEHYADEGRADDEREVLEALVRVGDTPAARLRLAEIYAAAGDTPRAVVMLDAAIRLAPGEPALRARRAALAGAATPSSPTGGGVQRSGTEGGDSDDRPAADASSLDDLIARTAADPGDLDAWVRVLDAAAGDPRGPTLADDARLFFPASPAVLAPAAEIYAAAGRADDARASARAGLDALDALGADAPPDAGALRERLARHLAP